jgi:hypothetical protein
MEMMIKQQSDDEFSVRKLGSPETTTPSKNENRHGLVNG